MLYVDVKNKVYNIQLNYTRGCMYTFGTHTEIELVSKDESYIYLRFIGIDLRVNKDYKVERLNRNGIWLEVSWHDNGNHQARTCIYNGNVKKTLSRARVICIAYHGLPPEDKQFVKHLNGDTMDDIPDNLQWANSLVKSTGAFRTEENIKLIEQIPQGQRNWSNPEYQKLFNHMKGADGLNHADRFRLKMKAQGLVRRKRIENGEAKYVWVPKGSPRAKRNSLKVEE